MALHDEEARNMSFDVSQEYQQSLYELVAHVQAGAHTRGLHSSTFQLNLSRFSHEIHPEYHLIPHNIP